MASLISNPRIAERAEAGFLRPTLLPHHLVGRGAVGEASAFSMMAAAPTAPRTERKRKISWKPGFSHEEEVEVEVSPGKQAAELFGYRFHVDASDNSCGKDEAAHAIADDDASKGRKVQLGRDSSSVKLNGNVQTTADVPLHAKRSDLGAMNWSDKGHEGKEDEEIEEDEVEGEEEDDVSGDEIVEAQELSDNEEDMQVDWKTSETGKQELGDRIQPGNATTCGESRQALTNSYSPDEASIGVPRSFFKDDIEARKPPFFCEFCPQRQFDNVTSLRAHYSRLRHPTTNMPPPSPSKASISKGDKDKVFVDPVAEAKPKTIIKCQLCSKRFSSMRGLNVHRKKSHNLGIHPLSQDVMARQPSQAGMAEGGGLSSTQEQPSLSPEASVYDADCEAEVGSPEREDAGEIEADAGPQPERNAGAVLKLVPHEERIGEPMHSMATVNGQVSPGPGRVRCPFCPDKYFLNRASLRAHCFRLKHPKLPLVRVSRRSVTAPAVPAAAVTAPTGVVEDGKCVHSQVKKELGDIQHHLTPRHVFTEAIAPMQSAQTSSEDGGQNLKRLSIRTFFSCHHCNEAHFDTAHRLRAHDCPKRHQSSAEVALKLLSELAFKKLSQPMSPVVRRGPIVITVEGGLTVRATEDEEDGTIDDLENYKRREVERHMAFACDQCTDKTFPSHQALSLHHRLKHMTEENMEVGAAAVEKDDRALDLQCGLCGGRKFATLKALSVHNHLKHRKQRPDSKDDQMPLVRKGPLSRKIERSSDAAEITVCRYCQRTLMNPRALRTHLSRWCKSPLAPSARRPHLTRLSSAANQGTIVDEEDEEDGDDGDDDYDEGEEEGLGNEGKEQCFVRDDAVAEGHALMENAVAGTLPAKSKETSSSDGEVVQTGKQRPRVDYAVRGNVQYTAEQSSVQRRNLELPSEGGDLTDEDVPLVRRPA